MTKQLKMECPNVALLKQYVEIEKRSYNDIASLTGWSRSKIYEWIKDYNIVTIKNRKIPPKDELNAEYTKFGSTLSSLAKKYDTSNHTIKKWLISYNISIKTHKDASTQANNRENKSKRLPEKTYEYLGNYEWLFQKRIIEKLSFESLGKILCCSEPVIKEACKKLKIPHVRHNESNSLSMSYLRNKEWLFREHKEKERKLGDIANELGSTKSTISRWLQFHGIEANNPNIYEKEEEVVSKECMDVINFILSMNIEVKVNDRKILNGEEIDILIPQYNFGIEYNGIYSHLFRRECYKKSARKDRYYHLQKTLKAKENAITLIHIYSDNWIFKKDICKSIIAVKLGKAEKIHARQCKIVELKNHEKISFFEQNHLQGNAGSRICYGLKKNNEIVAAMSFSHSRYNKKYKWEMVRFAVKKFHVVNGGFSKLFNYFLKNNDGSVITYADREISNGNVYEKNGFTLLKINRPGYHYVNLSKTIKRMHRSNFSKKKLNLTNDIRNEFEINEELGNKPIFDCGTLVYVYER